MKNQTIKLKPRTRINLNGEKGNAFYLLGLARKYCKMLGFDTVQVHREMTHSDYENLIKTFEKYFGDYVILER